MTFIADWSVWCSAQSREDDGVKVAKSCPTWEHVEGRKARLRAKDARSKGWRQVPKIGWLCPACYALYQESRRPPVDLRHSRLDMQ